MAEVVAKICDADQVSAKSPHQSFVYPLEASLWDKASMIATRVYGASEITANTKVREQLQQLNDGGHSHLPVCVAKTPYSFSTDPSLRGAPSNHVMDIREVRLSVGAGFVVIVCGDVMTMPGLPKTPASQQIDVVDGKITGLF